MLAASTVFNLHPGLTIDIKKSKLKLISINNEKSTRSDILENNEDYKDDNEEIYIFEITGEIAIYTYTWKIYKTFKQIKDLFEKIKNNISKLEMPSDKIIMNCKLIKNYTKEDMYKNIKKTSDLLINIFNNIDMEELKQELAISKASFSDNSANKPFEGFAMKKSEGFFGGWEKIWLILKNDMISYLNDTKELKGENLIWLDDNIELIAEKEPILIIKHLTKTISLKFDSIFERDLWKKEIETRKEQKVDEMMFNQYHSFTSQKSNCAAKWFVDAYGYFSFLFEQLKRAKKTVYITDWFMSPELALVRPINYEEYLKDDYKKNLNFNKVQRLMDLLYLLAQKGVKIYILLFCEMTVALSINSLHAKNTLESLHQNIKVTRHPKGTTSILWSHHEKLVIIDQSIAFVGGIDLCWGRYDINEHPIVEKENEAHLYLYPGADYINERQVDLHETEKFDKEQIDRNKMPRMGWHDIHTMVQGPIVNDIARHFVERWNYSRISKGNKKLVNVNTVDENKKKELINKSQIKSKKEEELKKYNSEPSIIFDRPMQTLRPNEINVINKIVDKIKKEKDNKIEDNDKKSEDNNQNNEDNDKNNLNDKDDILSKHTYNKKNINRLDDSLAVEDYLYSSKIKKTSTCTVYNENGKKEILEMNFKIQALRSVGKWSIGKVITERSILEGYYKLIDNAKHYIYIENQFFITKPFSETERNDSGLYLNNIVKNEIGLHLRARIERAYEEKANFKVFICIPLLPGFSGTPGESSTVNCILKHTYQSIAHNQGMSLLELLYKKMGEDINKYIFFFSLRNHGIINNVPVTELVYVHSKLLIVDDEKVLIGSANINDRSMLGSRDSEFAVIMEEEKNYESKMDKQKFMASKYAITLRKQIMSEHLGIKTDDPILEDPLNNELWSTMISRAQVNTMIYRVLFNCFPDNEFNNFAKLKSRKDVSSKEDLIQLKKEYDSKSIGIVGHIVEYPIQFLKDEQLDIDFFSKENMIPEKSYT